MFYKKYVKHVQYGVFAFPLWSILLLLRLFNGLLDGLLVAALDITENKSSCNESQVSRLVINNVI